MSETDPESHDLSLVFLGTGNAFSAAQRYWGSVLVNNSILLDASPIVVPHMKRLNRSLDELEHIFITHFHGDHFLGLPFLLLDFGYLIQAKQPLTMIGPTGIEDMVTKITELAFPGLFEKLSNNLKLNYLEVPGPGKYEVNGVAQALAFHAEPMSHGTATAYGYKFTVAGKTIAYTGDTDLCDGVYSLAKDADILIIEFSNPDIEVPGHMSRSKLDSLQERISTDTKIILTHVGEFTGGLQKNDNLILPNDLDIKHF